MEDNSPKEKCLNMSIQGAFDHAIVDLESNYGQYYKCFASH
jgi:hypothetical protein